MKREILVATILSILSTSSAFSDEISGGARANFGDKELIIPCVQVVNSDNEGINGQFFDVVLKQRGKSLNYEVVLGEQEDSETCIAAIDAMLENDDGTNDIEGDATDITGDSEDDDSDEGDDDSDEGEDDSKGNNGKGNSKK